jgi:hypothetical protein
VNSTNLNETLRHLVIDGNEPLAVLNERVFDLTASESHIGFLFTCSKSSAASVDKFVAQSIRRALGHLDIQPGEYAKELAGILVREFSGPLVQSTAWLQAIPKGATESHELRELISAKCVYYLHEVGPPPVQEFVIAETERDYAAIFWYTTG